MIPMESLRAALPVFDTGKAKTGVTCPILSPSIGDKWAVTDPVTGHTSMLKVWLPFRSAVRMQSGFNPKVVELKKLPNFGVWATAQYGDQRVADLVPDFDPAYRPEWSHVFKILQTLKNANHPGR